MFLIKFKMIYKKLQNLNQFYTLIQTLNQLLFAFKINETK